MSQVYICRDMSCGQTLTPRAVSGLHNVTSVLRITPRPLKSQLQASVPPEHTHTPTPNSWSHKVYFYFLICNRCKSWPSPFKHLECQRPFTKTSKIYGFVSHKFEQTIASFQMRRSRVRIREIILKKQEPLISAYTFSKAFSFSYSDQKGKRSTLSAMLLGQSHRVSTCPEPRGLALFSITLLSSP